MLFRIISTNAQLGLRPVILLKVRPNKGGLLAPSSLQLNSSSASLYALNQALTRSNSNVSNGNIQTPKHLSSNVDAFLAKAQRDPLLRDVIDSERESKLHYFQEQLNSAHQYRTRKDLDGKRAFANTVQNVFNLFDDKELRGSLNSKDLFQYAHLLSFSVYHNRTSRLTGSKNRDSDQYHSENLHDELLLKSAVLNTSDIVMSGELNKILNANILLFVFFAMLQFLMHPEMINLWENGVTDNEVGHLYLNEKILAVILPVAFDSKKFSYEEILHIYDLNTKDIEVVYHELLTSIGKIAIRAGDYSRGLDSLESLLQQFEARSKDQRKVLSSLGDLHLSFIGSCKDIKIARHFFDKVIQFDLPYPVKLKVPHIQSLLENCYESDEPFDNILYFWKSTIKHYQNENKGMLLNSRYSILNNTFFQIFFKKYPSMNEESFEKLKEVIRVFSEIKPIDEVFLNTIIGNYSWGDKAVFEQLVLNYSIYNIRRTPVSYRICLKKTGDIPDYTNEEILGKWNESLKNLDDSKFTYIPIADWAALRDSTILSPKSSERKDLYLSIVQKYKDYIQDERSCVRFIRNWMKRPEHFKDLALLALDKNPEIKNFIEIDIPHFNLLRPCINYNDTVSKVLNNN
ncbi:uncharacterized protein PRCAT00002793001 [Priceomyces carsonii]|uniref:uncharacterized protein n=1 Tax=Priceomyces carsonii TaxID=28549 RepID=UPI002ED837E6|nr:unnamed protein product [Priceomyces carsonii]